MDGALTLPMNFLVSPCQAHSPSGCGGEYHYTGILSFDGEKFLLLQTAHYRRYYALLVDSTPLGAIRIVNIAFNQVLPTRAPFT